MNLFGKTFKQEKLATLRVCFKEHETTKNMCPLCQV